MAIRQLKTAREVIAFLGTEVVKQLTVERQRPDGCTDQVLTNWRSSGRISHRFYLIMSEALRRRGASAPPSIWGIYEVPKRMAA